MKTLYKLILLAAIFAGNIPSITAQSVPSYPLTKDAEKLAHKLTDGLSSDSAKVLAIHDWITNHIKYDIKKWKKLDLSTVPIKKILKKRKAICTGYSDLFNELCSAAKIRSVAVPGYIKEIHVDLVDNFYLDEHIWNAVYVNDEWKLVDACWDAGYIAYNKRTFFGYLVYLASGGKHDILKYKPHFVKYPVHTYYCRQGKFFKNDHLALNPTWQLNNPVISIKKFQEDSAYYLKKYDVAYDLYQANNEAEVERNIYYSMDESEKTIADGNAGTKFNFRNQYRLGLGLTEEAKNKFAGLNPESKDTLAQIKICDTTLKLAERSMVQYDSNSYYLMQQKQELSLNNRIKNRMLTEQNLKLMAATNSIIRNLKNRKPSCDKIRKTNSKTVRTYYKSLEKALESDAFDKKKHAKTTNYNDSLKYENQALNYGDTLSRQHDKLELHYILLDSLYENAMRRTERYKMNLMKLISLENTVTDVRFDFYDDFDHEIRWLKDTVLKYKYPNDSLLFTDNYFFTKAISGKLSKLRSEVSRHLRFYRIRSAILIKFKGACVNNPLVAKEYAQNLEDMNTAFETFSGEMDKWAGRLNMIKAFCQKQKGPARRELKAYKKEKKVEDVFCRIRKKYIDSHYRSLAGVNKAKKSEAEELKKNSEKARKRW